MAKRITQNGVVQSTLEKEIEAFEFDIDQAIIEAGEEWMRIARDLYEIRERFRKAKKEKAFLFGCKNWEEYCDSERSRYAKTHANRMIANRETRLQFPTPTGSGIVWTERAVRQLSEAKLPSEQLQKSTAKRALMIAEKEGIPLTTAVRKACEIVKETKAYQRQQEAKEADERESIKPASNLKTLLAYTRKHMEALQAWPAAYWTAAEEEEPGITATVADALEQLAEFLRD